MTLRDAARMSWLQSSSRKTAERNIFLIKSQKCGGGGGGGGDAAGIGYKGKKESRCGSEGG